MQTAGISAVTLPIMALRKLCIASSSFRVQSGAPIPRKPGSVLWSIPFSKHLFETPRTYWLCQPSWTLLTAKDGVFTNGRVYCDMKHRQCSFGLASRHFLFKL